MLALDITGVLGKTITPAFGIPERDLEFLGDSLTKALSAFLAERERGEHAWTKAPLNNEAAVEVETIARRLRALRCETIAWIGIGGSGLGPRVLKDVFETRDTPEFLLIDSVDPAVVAAHTEDLDWRRTALIVASKSGTTLESMSVFLFLLERLQRALGENTKQRVVILTDPVPNPLRTFAQREGFTILPIPPDIGGRYSIFTPIGLLPLALLGGDTVAFLSGAQEMDAVIRNSTFRENPAMQLAGIQYLLDVRRDYPLRVMVSYVGMLQNLPRWSQQLLAESLGKSEAYGPTPLAALGTQDQHSLLQQWLAGRRNSWFLLLNEGGHPDLRFPESPIAEFSSLSGRGLGEVLDALTKGTVESLKNSRRPHAVITLPTVDETHLGQLFFLLMVEVILLSKLYRIDPYGQPAVEFGKQVAKAILEGDTGHVVR
jgi:glucose-6-phosphate isomerase